ncbi:tryptophan synthase subunit alpha [Veillonella montpellierensis]|uniref:tryptophan synthase subunit alpha n=1 Tax=Veillonella montpellierensis TaxID=187328 RepID=UPI003C6FA65E
MTSHRPLEMTKQHIMAAFRQKAFIPFITAGDLTISDTERYIHTMAQAGADMIEIGIPFSDPVAEGPVIQRASERALQGGLKIDHIFAMVKRLRQGKDQREALTIPLILMTYINPIVVYGKERFFSACADVGIDGVIVPDCPFEEKGELIEAAHACGVCVISMIAPTSKNRIEMIASEAEGFIYCVSSLGVTGMRGHIQTDLPTIVSTIRQYTNIPVAIGFGISNPAQAKTMASVADGAVVGSALVAIVADKGSQADAAIHDYVSTMKVAVEEANT